MAVQSALELDSCLCPEHHPCPYNSRQRIFAPSRLGSYHPYTFWTGRGSGFELDLGQHIKLGADAIEQPPLQR